MEFLIVKFSEFWGFFFLLFPPPTPMFYAITKPVYGLLLWSAVCAKTILHDNPWKQKQPLKILLWLGWRARDLRWVLEEHFITADGRHGREVMWCELWVGETCKRHEVRGQTESWSFIFHCCQCVSLLGGWCFSLLTLNSLYLFLTFSIVLLTHICTVKYVQMWVLSASSLWKAILAEH